MFVGCFDKTSAGSLDLGHAGAYFRLEPCVGDRQSCGGGDVFDAVLLVEDCRVVDQRRERSASVVDQPQHASAVLGRQLHLGARFVDVTTPLGNPIAHDQSWVSEGAGEPVSQRARGGRLSEIDHERGHQARGPATRQQIGRQPAGHQDHDYLVERE